MGLVLANQAYETIRAAKNCQDRTDTVFRLWLDDDGSAKIGVTRRLYGTAYNEMKRYFSELPPEERRRYFQQLVSSMAQGAHAVGELTTRFDTYPGLLEYTVAVDNYCVVDGDYCYFDLPFTPSLFPPWPDRRILPLYLPDQGHKSVRTEIALPSGFHEPVIMPHDETLIAPDGAGTTQITASSSADTCVITHEFETRPAIVDPKDYPAMLNIGAALGKKSAKVFLLKKRSQGD